MSNTTTKFLEALQAEMRKARVVSDRKNGELAAAMGMSPSTLSGWFRGSGTPPRIDDLYELARQMGLPLSELIRNAEEAVPS